MRIIFLILLLFSTFVSSAGGKQVINLDSLKTGDFIFQDIDCGPMCDAIEAVTPAYQGEHFSHIGIIFIRNRKVMVLEAIGEGVHLTPILQVLKRSANPTYIGRLQSKDTLLIGGMIHFGLKQIGLPYDDDFQYNNGKYYCSELVYDACKTANRGVPFFQMHPMTFKIPGNTQTFPVWEKYFSNKKIPIPEGKPGCNPGGIATSGKLKMYLLKGH